MMGNARTPRGARVRGRLLLATAVALVSLLAVPAAALAANAYGQTFAGQDNCLSCHGNTTGRWQVGTYTSTAHGQFVTDVQETTSALVPGPSFWPSPSLGTGLRYSASEIWLMLGAPGILKEYVTIYRNDGPHVINSGQTLNPVPGPPDDYLMVEGAEWSPELNTWEIPKPVTGAYYFQGCGGCHFLGLTRPTETTVTLGSGAVAGHSTETSYSGFGIQCEHCHGTGKAGTSHWTSGVDIVRTKQALKSQVCGQCHVNGTAKEKNYLGKTYSGPNGFTPDRKLEDFYNVAASQYVKTSRDMPQPSIPMTETKVYPNGTNKSMNHSYYNEWMLTPHARSFKYKNGDLWSTDADDSCLRCHSGEGFLNSIDYGADGPNDVSFGGSSLETDELNIECAVCHTIHAKDGEALGLRMEGDELCSACHNSLSEEGEEFAAGAYVVHPQSEMRKGYGLIGVEPSTEPFMGETTCPECHMPEARKGRISHGFKVMTPGNATAWNVWSGGDSCTPCHTTRSRAALQANLDEWATDIADASEAASSALAAARARVESSTPAGTDLIGSAYTNLSYVSADRSHGAHNYPYAMEGLEKATYYARSVGAGYSRFGATGYDSTRMLAMVYGTFEFGDGLPGAGESVTIQAKPAGTSSWVDLSATTVGADGDFAFAVGPTGTTSYRAAWSPKGGITVYSSSATVTMGSKTSVKVSSARFALGRTTTVSGAVSPSHSGLKVTVRYKRGSTGTWRTLSTRTLSGSSTYSFGWRPSARGTYYLQTSFGGDVSHRSSKSSTVSLKVY